MWKGHLMLLLHWQMTYVTYIVLFKLLVLNEHALHSKELEREEQTKGKNSLAKRCNHADGLGVVRGLNTVYTNKTKSEKPLC